VTKAALPPVVRCALVLVVWLMSTALMNLATAAPADAAAAGDDPYLWLEEVQSERALAWVRERNAASRALLERHPRFEPTRARILEILDSRDKIPAVARIGDEFYNHWQDADHPRGLWRRTTLAEYRKPAPAWQTVIDLDALAAAENENWVWHGADCFGPAYRRCIVSLSRGGADASVLREFDLVTRRFVDATEGGFFVPEAKSSIEWLDEDTVYVGTDLGPGTMTDSGYPRTIRRWRRGTPLATAPVVFEGEAGDVMAWVSVDRTPGFERTVFGRSLDFYHQRRWLEPPRQGGAGRIELDLPRDASLRFWRERLLVELKSDWSTGGQTFARGTLLATDAADFLAGQRRFFVLFTPTPTRSLEAFATTRSRVLLTILDNVAGRAEEWKPSSSRAPAARWVKRDVAAPFPGALSLRPLHDPLRAGGRSDPLAEKVLLSYADFLTPDSLMLGTAGRDERQPLKSRPRFFDSTGMRVEQRFATSKDGTRVPYFVVWPAGAGADGRNPTLLYGYGGFEIPLLPAYSGARGSAWHAHGGVLVIANIRGGGEFGPAWHRAAIKADKQKSYDDFIAVAEDLIAARITSPKHLGIQGGSNGGLLVCAVMLQRPELFNAVVCQVPLLDMRRYHRLLAGASWVAEYGDPDQGADWAVISRYSPYQNVRREQKLPRTLLITSTRDDRVHPGHARKMAARMQEQQHDVLYYENLEGGHAAAADNRQRADMMALEFSFLWQQLGR
jgi:prolyl oligopeptidase